MTHVSESTRRLLLATSLAIVTAVAVIVIFNLEDDTGSAPVKTVPVLVAKTYIAVDTPLSASLFVEKPVPEIYAPPRPISKKDLATAHNAGRFRARGEILKGEALTASRVSDAAAAKSFGWSIREDELAITLHLTPEGAMAGVVGAGDNVHLLATFAAKTCVLVPRTRVLVANDAFVTLALPPKEALRAALAAQKSTLSLGLLSPLSELTPPACVGSKEL